MSIHPSLSTSIKQKKQRSVLKRIEKIKFLMEKSLWAKEKGPFGLPKVKTVRIKIKKEKAAAKTPEEVQAQTQDVPAQETAKPSEAKTPSAKQEAPKK